MIISAFYARRIRCVFHYLKHKYMYRLTLITLRWGLLAALLFAIPQACKGPDTSLWKEKCLLTAVEA